MAGCTGAVREIDMRREIWDLRFEIMELFPDL